MVAPYQADEVKKTFSAPAPELLDLFDYAATDTAGSQFENVVTALSSELIGELDWATEFLGVSSEEILLAALGRTFGRTRGDGTVVVNVVGNRRPCPPVVLMCAASPPMGPTEMLQGAHNGLVASFGHPETTSKSEILLNTLPGGGQGSADHSAAALEVHVARVDGALQLAWCFDTGRLARYSVEEMAEQFPLALIEITSDAAAPL